MMREVSHVCGRKSQVKVNNDNCLKFNNSVIFQRIFKIQTANCF